MDRAAVIQAVLNAFQRPRRGTARSSAALPGQGFTIEGYFQNGRINTAYPIYTRN